MAALLQIRNLATYFYTDMGVLKAVDGISYDINEGETLGIVGESGCGKSVSALSIMRLIPNPPGKIVDGEVIFEGSDLLRTSDSNIRQIRGNQISMIFQEPMTSLNPVLSIGRQLTEILELHLRMSPTKARERAIELMKMVGFPDPEQSLNGYPHQLSGGMRQRVMIAMAISCNPRLIIADEPTTALDVTIQAQILDLMQNLSQQLGMALILITHNLGIIARHATRILVMYAGKIVETGEAQDIYQDHKHPYTMGLLNSVPRLDAAALSKLTPIEGLPPNLIDLPEGCSFAPRCNYSTHQCITETPPLTLINGHRNSACWRWRELANLASQYR